MSSADLVQTNGLGSLFHSLIHLRMSFSSSVTLRWAERRSLRLVSSANQRSINRLSGISAVMSGFGGSLKSLQMALDAGDHAGVPGDFGVPAAFGRVIAERGD